MTGLVETWSAALAGTCCAPLTHKEQIAFLRGLAARLPADGYRVGADLVANDFATPEVLGHTITVLAPHLPVDCVEALSTGFARALHDRALEAQEAVRRAALAAKTRAEHALRAGEARFRYLALRDALTGLPNRTLFTDRLHEILAAPVPGSRLAVCCLDLDGFGLVNNSLGHGVGDRLLMAAADRLRELTAESGHLVARLDSDEFAILLESTSGPEDALKMADQAMTVLGEPFHVDDHELPLTASAGVVERSAVGTDTAEMLRAAGIALHWAKADGKARCRLFAHDRSTTDVARYRLTASMPAALRRGEFTLAYQPLVDLGSRRLAGVEALARWRHPELGLLGADRFIPPAEDTGLIVWLGAKLLRQACEQATRWHDLTADAPYVSVNLAAGQLRHPGLVADIAEILDDTGLEPRRLQLEITEHAVVDTGPTTVATLNAIARLGVRIAVDDFGTGYCNLAYLPALPLDGLKLAATFVGTDDRFLGTVVSVGHSLGLTVTAEGVETTAQAHQARRVGCDLGQGWRFGRPAPAHRITQMIRAG